MPTLERFLACFAEVPAQRRELDQPVRRVPGVVLDG
jgi:hypothetical protein